MTDEEMRCLCAEAMGWKHLGARVELPPNAKVPSDLDETYKGKVWCLSGGNDWWLDPEGYYVCGLCSAIPDPLYDDAQAMAMVKKMNLSIQREFPMRYEGENLWGVTWSTPQEHYGAANNNLNRAICECVAKIQNAKNDSNRTRKARA